MFDNFFIKKYLRENNGEKEVDGLSGYTLRENDIKFINKMFKKIV